MKVADGAWKIGINDGFSASVGKGGKFINKYLTNDYPNKVLSTPADFDIVKN